MKINFFRALPVAMLSFATTSAFAAMDMDSRVSQLEKQMKEVRVENAIGTYGATTATARADVDGQGWFIMLGPIYEQVSVGGTEFTYTDQDPAGNFPVRGRSKDIDFDWDWGIRAAIGYNFEYDSWDTNLEYTWLSTSGSRSVTAGLNSIDIPLKGAARIVSNCSTFSSFEIAKIAKSQFDFDYNTLVLELGRQYFLSKMLAVRPHIGLRTSWIELQQVTRYSGGEQSDNGLGVHTVDIKDESDFWGLGLRAGLNTNWFLGNGFSIFGNFSSSLLFGVFDVDHREKFTLCQDTTGKIKIDANQHRFVPVGALQLGLAYQRYINDNKQHVYIRLGYDTVYYWRANQTLKINDNTTLKYERYTEDVAMNGLMLDVKLSF